MKDREKAIYIVASIILIAVLYFGFDSKPSSQKALEKSRALNTEKFDIRSLAKEAKSGLQKDEAAFLETLETQLNHVTEDSQKIVLLKELSGYWFSVKQPILAGLYAREVAALSATAQGWSIVGTTFASALRQEGLEAEKITFAREQAADAFEKAISMEPSVVDHRINQALCFVEAPLQDQPMKGIQMLAGLAKDYPQSALPPYHLARLAIRTGQYDRALERIQQAMTLEPENAKFACLAIEINTALNRMDDQEKLKALCAGQ